MIINADPRKLQGAVKKGLDRIKTYRNTRALFIKEFAGQYFRETKGLTGDTPINLLFSTIRAYVPNLVMKSPINDVTTDVLSHKDYAELLGFSLNNLQEQIKLKKILRAWIVNAIFAIGILETGLASSDNIYSFGDVDIDPGQIFTQNIDLDDFVLDPNCTALDEALFLGHIVRTPRAKLYEIEDLDHDLIERLPNALVKAGGDSEKNVEELSKRNINNSEMQDIEDYVEVVKLWVPEANSIVYIPDPRVTTFDEFIGVKDFYGPKDGPYSFLSFTPPVPNNPLPVAPVGIWYDLHNMANRVFKKLMEQVDAQKDVVLFRPELADVVQDLVDAENLDTVACNDPAGVTTISLGGQNRDNVEMAGQLSVWYNYIAGNPEQMAGIQQASKTATQAQIMQANSSVTLNDMRDIAYDETGGVSKKQAWYLHTDPLINMPFTKRTTGGEEIQLWLTPEQREPDFLQFGRFKIRQRSMSRLDPQIRSKRIEQFATNTVPAAAMAAQVCMQMGIPFNLQRFLTNLAEELDFSDFMTDVFNDPEFQQKLEIMLQMGPQNQGKASMNPTAVSQQGGFPMSRGVKSPGQENRSMSQETAGISQSARTVGGY